MIALKIIKKAFIIFFCFLLVSVSASAKEYGWFFKSQGKGKQPIIADGSKLPDEYGCIYMGNPDDKKVYLTFDAGYENGNVEKTLDVLKKHSVPATFFILPNLIVKNTRLVKRMTDEGHTVGNHTKSHKNMAKVTSYREFCDQIQGLEEIYREYTGLEMSKYFRPPEGSYSEETLQYSEKLGVTPVFWSFAYADWDNNKQMSPDSAFDKITQSLHNGMVLLLHPTSKTNADILDRVIVYIKEQGYTFCSLDDFS